MNEQEDGIIPISRLFYDDAGPHVIRSSGTLTPPRGQQLHDLLGASIAQLGNVSGESRRITPPASAPIPIQTLLYRGRAALDRALEIRAEVLATGVAPPQQAIDELLDLVAMAATD